MKKLTIYICGNPLLNFDNIPLKLEKKLSKIFPQIKFQYLDPNENIKPINYSLVIIDTALNIDKVELINDIEQINTSPNYSLHDFDLGMNLKLLAKLNLLKNLTIFAVPNNIKLSEALRQLTVKIQSYINEFKAN